MPLSVDQIESVAPDQASLNAASKLLKRSKWPMLQHDANAQVLWGQCQGSGSTPYSMSVAVHDLGAKCSCPSRKFPCKHSIALMWWFAENSQEFEHAEMPDWVSGWLSRRRGASENAEQVSKPSLSASSAKLGNTEKPKDPEAEIARAERSAKQKTRNRAAREESIARGLDDLDLWISDQLEQGLAGFDSRAQQQAQTVIKRLMDAKAAGLALRVEKLIAKYFGQDYELRNSGLIEDLGMLHLLAEAYRKQSKLPIALQADVRQAIGWTTEREQLLDNPESLSASGEWLVTGVREQVQEDRLIRHETWLMPCSASTHGTAVMMDFVPVTSGAGRSSAYMPGQCVKGKLTYYPSATPLRALISDSSVSDSGSVETALLRDSNNLEESLLGLYDKRAENPWLENWPITVKQASVKRTKDERLWLSSDGCDNALPIAPSLSTQISVMLGLRDVVMHGLFNGENFEPLVAVTPLGLWWRQPG